MNLNHHVCSHIFGPCSVSVNTYSLGVEILKYDVSGATFTDFCSYQHLFKSGMARDEMISKTLTRILILLVHLCLKGTMEEPTRACLKTFFCPGVRDIMLSLCGLQ